MPGAEITEPTVRSLSGLPEYLIVATFPASHQDLVTEALERAGARRGTLPAAGNALPTRASGPPAFLTAPRGSDPSAILQWLNADPAAHCLCIVKGPIAYMASALKQGSDLEQAAAGWRREAQSALELIRQHRFQCLAVLLEQLQAEPGRFAQVVWEKCGVELTPAIERAEPDPEDTLFSILAAQYLSQQTHLADIALELEASAWRLTETDPSTLLDPQVAVEAYHGERRQRDQLAQNIKELESLRGEHEQSLKVRGESPAGRERELEEENNALLDQLHTVQLEVEKLADRHDREKRNNAVLIRARDSLKAERASLSEVIAQLERRIKECDGVISDHKKTIRELKQRITAIHLSTSWRLTTPLRLSGRMLKWPFRRR